MRLSDIRDYIASLGISDNIYMGTLPVKQDESIGVYNSKHQQAYSVCIGGASLASYEAKYVTLLIHWNKSPAESEETAQRLFEALRDVREVTINQETIKFVQLLYEAQDVGKDDSGICEWVIEAVFICKKG